MASLKSKLSKVLNAQMLLRISAFLVVAVLIIALFPRYSTDFRYHYEVGKPWGYSTLTAPFDFPLYKTEAQLADERAKVLTSFVPRFKYIPGVQQKKRVISTSDSVWLRDQKYTKIAIRKGNNVTDTLPLTKVFTPITAYDRSTHTEYPRNLVLDTAFTDSMRVVHLAVVSNVEDRVQKGQRIIENGEIVEAKHMQILQSLARAYETRSSGLQRSLLSKIGESMMVMLFLALFITYLFVFRPDYIRKTSIVLFFCLQILIVILLACLALRFGLSVYIIPFAWVPILTRVFLDSRTALFLHFTTVLIASIFVPAPEIFFFIQIAAGMVAVSSLSDMTRRAQLVQTAGWVLFVQVIAYSAITFAQAGSLDAIIPMTYVYFAISAIFTIGCYGLIYSFEKMFHFISSITLVELTDINSDLLHQLAEKAPGTFQHSMQVSNLASEAAKAIGANALLVRTGALYHDIGKIIDPLYYVENQTGIENPLLLMDPRDAAQVVIAHVSEGEKLARKSHLPEAVINFITTHHGNSLVRYFYNTYCNAHPAENVDQKIFRYPGPKPSTKEGAILMMADAIEARSRSLADFSENSISTAVNQMIDSQIADGQFSETPLSFKDVETIRRVFTARLTAMNHHRIAYPTLNKNNQMAK